MLMDEADCHHDHCTAHIANHIKATEFACIVKQLVIWDGLQGHRTRLVKDFVAAQKGRLELERLPAYAPELNPVEYLWGHLKHHELPNLCPKNLGELSIHAIRALRRLRRRPTLVAAFWKQSGLFEKC